MNMDTVNQYLDAYGYGVIFIFFIFWHRRDSSTGRVLTRPDRHLKWSKRRTFNLFDLDRVCWDVRRYADGIWSRSLLRTDCPTIRSIHRIDEGTLGAGVKRLHGTNQSNDHRRSLYSGGATDQSIFCRHEADFFRSVLFCVSNRFRAVGRTLCLTRSFCRKDISYQAGSRTVFRTCLTRIVPARSAREMAQAEAT